MAVIIEIQNRQTRTTLNLPKLRQQIHQILKGEGVRQGQLSVVFVTDRVIRDLNRRFLNEDRPTDVLAFDMTSELRRTKRGSRVSPVDGEIVISVPTALRQAKIFAAHPKDELLLYVIHGILHLVGYDDHALTDIKKMRSREGHWLSRLTGREMISSPSGKGPARTP